MILCSDCELNSKSNQSCLSRDGEEKNLKVKISLLSRTYLIIGGNKSAPNSEDKNKNKFLNMIRAFRYLDFVLDFTTSLNTRNEEVQSIA